MHEEDTNGALMTRSPALFKKAMFPTPRLSLALTVGFSTHPRNACGRRSLLAIPPFEGMGEIRCLEESIGKPTKSASWSPPS